MRRARPLFPLPRLDEAPPPHLVVRVALLEEEQLAAEAPVEERALEEARAVDLLQCNKRRTGKGGGLRFTKH